MREGHDIDAIWSVTAQELTKIINKKNESAAASKAEQNGGHLGVVKAPPAEGKDKKKEIKGKK